MSNNINSSPTLKAIAISLLSCTLGASLSHDFKAISNDSSNKHHKAPSEHHPDHDHPKERRKKKFLENNKA